MANETYDIIPRGDEALIQFSVDPDASGPLNVTTLWLVDTNKLTMRPFLTEQAIMDWTGKTREELVAGGYIAKLSPDILRSKGYNVMQDQYGVKDGATYINPPTPVTTSALNKKYGKPYDSTTTVNGVKAVKSILEAIKGDPKSGISAGVIDQAVNNANTMGLYFNAIAYGGYGVNDIFRDLKRQEMVAQGKTQYKDVQVISPDVVADTYFDTTQGISARNDSNLTPPQWLGDINTDLLNNPVMQLSDKLFQQLVPVLDPTTPEGKAEIDKVKASFYDITIRQLEATTSQEKAAADYEYNVLKESIEKKYNVQLSNDSTTAWNQLETLFTGMGKRGLTGSGIEAENMDDYLRQVRYQDQLLREEKMTNEEAAQYNYLKKYGTPDQINSLSELDKVKYGFKPSQEIMDSISKENLKKQFPDLTDEDINKYYEQLFDPNGNFKSEIYKKLTTNVQQQKKEKFDYQTDVALAKSNEDIEDAYGEWNKLGTGEKPEEGSNIPKTHWEIDPATGKQIEVPDAPTSDTTGAGDTTGAPAPATPGTSNIPEAGAAKTYTDADWDAAWNAVNASAIPVFDQSWGADYPGGRVAFALAHRKNIFGLYKSLLSHPPTPKEVNDWLTASPNIGDITRGFQASDEYKNRWGDKGPNLNLPPQFQPQTPKPTTPAPAPAPTNYTPAAPTTGPNINYTPIPKTTAPVNPLDQFKSGAGASDQDLFNSKIKKPWENKLPWE